MKVILLEEIKNLGKKFDVKNIADGYARNFLLPKNLVKKATAPALKALAVQKAAWEIKEKSLIEELKKRAAELEKTELEFFVKVGDRKKVYGSIGETEIKEALAAKGFGDVAIEIEKPIKTLGGHAVKVKLGRGVESTIKVALLEQP